MRVYELFIRLGAANAAALDQIAAAGVLDPLLSCVSAPRSDVLWNLNALELLKTVG